MDALTLSVPVVGLVIAGLLLWRHADRRADQRAMCKMLDAAAGTDRVFHAALVDGLPEPARRYFIATIREGTPIRTVVDITMRGEFGLGTKADPKYRQMSATQRLAPPSGLVWRLQAAPISGSDGMLDERSWSRFWLFGLLPVARAGKTSDHRRSAFGRVVAEAAFWSPASLLPGEHVRWEALDETTARAQVRSGELEQSVDITIDDQGLPSEVLIPRWSNENPERVYRVQPFGGRLSGFRDFDGYRLPTRVEGGNHFGTDDYFPFYRAEVTDLRFP